MEPIRKIGRIKSGGQFRTFYIFKCPLCKSEVKKRMDVGKKALSCGCDNGHDKRIYDGVAYANTPIYKTWSNMMHRAGKLSAYKNVSVCEEWKVFLVFKEWAENNGYSDNLTLDRIDNDGNYEPDNCEFVSLSYNTVKRRNVKLDFDKAEQIRNFHRSGISKKELSEMYGVGHRQICHIINNETWRKRYVKR
jgi:hypothetical protein